MSEVQRAMYDSAERRGGYEKVKLLFDYTKFHIGLYATVGSGILTVFKLNVFHVNPWPLRISVVLIAVAGWAGGIIASTLPECGSLEEFFAARTGFWGVPMFSGRTFTKIEHTAFWLGLISGVIAFAPFHENRTAACPAPQLILLSQSQ